MKKGKFVLIIILSLLIPITLFANTNVQATTNINYTFENENFFNYTSPVYEADFNVRNSSTYLGHYNATYSFENETGFPSNWVDNSGVDCEISILDNLSGHNDVLSFVDKGVGACISTINVIQGLDTKFEFWITKNATASSLRGELWFYEDSTRVIALRWVSDDLDYWNGSSQYIKQDYVEVNKFDHYKLVLNDTVNTFEVYINGILEGSNLGYENPSILGINDIMFRTHTTENTYEFYLDALGWDTDPFYNTADNFVPLLEIDETVKEVDKWEFAYSDFPTQYTVGSDVFSDWTEVDTGDHINIVKDYNSLDGNPSYYPDKKIEIHDHIVSSADIGIEREFDILDGILNVSWSLNFTELDGVSQSEITTEVYSNDDTLIAQIYLEMGDICYKDGGEVVLEFGVIDTGEIYDFNLYVNFNDNLMILSFSIDGVYYDNYIIPSLNSDKKGLGKIKFKNYYDPNREMIVYLDNIGVYSNGTSLSNEVGFRQIDLDQFLFHDYWEFKNYSLLYLDLEGFIGVYLTDWYFYVGYGNIEQLIPTRQFNGLGEVFNVADQTHDGNDYIYTPKLWLEFYGQIENSTEINVNGIVLTDGTNDYTMEFTSGNVRINESYFYVDSSNRLQYQIYFNDTNTEYIQIAFDVPNIYTDNYTNSFSSFQYGYGYGYYGYEFDDSNVQAFPFSTSYTKKSYYLTNHKTIDQLTILITDNNLFNIGNGHGYIDDITFTYLTNVSFTLTTLSLLSVLIVIIMMFVPALLVSLRYERKYLLPMLLLMTIVSYASALIPVWLMFIFIFGFIGILFIQKDEVKE